MNGSEFFIPAAIAGVFLGGFTGLISISRKWDAAEKTGIQLALELCLFTTILALLPYPLYYLGDEIFALRISSMAMALFVGVEIGRVYKGTTLFGSNWPTVLLLALSGIFLTMEFINAIAWNSLGVYIAGLLWIVLLSGIQFIAFVIYDRQDRLRAAQHRHPVRVRGVGETGYPNNAPNTGTISNYNRTGTAGFGRNTHSNLDGFSRFPGGRTIGNAAVRPNADKRSTDTYPRFKS